MLATALPDTKGSSVHIGDLVLQRVKEEIQKEGDELLADRGGQPTFVTIQYSNGGILITFPGMSYNSLRWIKACPCMCVSL